MQAAAALIVVFAVLTALLAAARLTVGRVAAAAGYLLLAIALAMTGLAVRRLAADLASYEALNPGRPVAELYFERTGAERFRVTLTRLPEGRMSVYELGGDEWRISARSLEWSDHDWDPGLGSRYRLELIEARLSASAEPTPEETSRYPLSAGTGEESFGRLLSGTARRGFVSAGFAQGDWQPVKHKARVSLFVDDGAISLQPMDTAIESLGEAATR